MRLHAAGILGTVTDADGKALAATIDVGMGLNYTAEPRFGFFSRRAPPLCLLLRPA